jgi:hypothetical protein
MDSFSGNFESTEELIWGAAWLVIFVLFLCAT